MEYLRDLEFHRLVAWCIIGLSPVVIILLLVWNPSTYGKLHNVQTNLFGPKVSATYAWMIFESPNWIWVLYSIYDMGGLPNVPNTVLLGWFFLHYVHRSILYPLQMASESKFPVGLMAFTLPYCIVNGYLQTQSLCRFQSMGETYLFSTRFALGMLVTIIGFTIGFQSDQTLLELRRTSPHTYQIPFGGMFDYVSCPHYLGEILEWCGFCLACNGSLASLSFALWTAANLVPRALRTHSWYQQKFDDYPLHRKAIIPFLL